MIAEKHNKTTISEKKNKRNDSPRQAVSNQFFYLDVLIIQNGKNINRNNNHEIAKSPKQTLAANPFSEYLNTLAVSMKTSLVSCNARITDPIRKKLHHRIC